MKSKSAVAALAALAQENRLAAFRALVQAGRSGLCPGDLGEQIRVPGTTLSFHLAQLRHAGLVNVTREGRSLRYVANFAAVNALIGFLTENCCAGDEKSCAAPRCIPEAALPGHRWRAGAR